MSRSLRCSRSCTLVLGLFVSWLSASPSQSQELLERWQRVEMETSGKVDSALIEALAAKPRVRLIALFDVAAPEGGLLKSFRSTEGRGALELERGRILSVLPEGRFDLTFAYRSISMFAGETDAEGLLALASHPSVRLISEDRKLAWSLAEAGPLAGIPAARKAAKSGKKTWVAVLDSGIDTDHRDLKKPLKAEECSCDGFCCPDGTSRQSGKGSAEDDVGHGTLVAGTISSQGKQSAKGVAPKAKLLMMKVGDAFGPQDSNVFGAIDYILTEKPEVVAFNMSFGSFEGYGGNCDKKGSANKAWSAVMDTVKEAGIVAISSSGNGARTGKMSSPACLKEVVSVGAVYDDDFGGVGFGSCQDATTGPNQLVCFTDRSGKIDLLAPGASITGPALGGSGSSSGTSFSSPIATGCVVLLAKKYPDATPKEIRAALKASSTQVGDSATGRTYPSLNCEESLDFLGDG